jgi:hypothetical protein
MPTIPQEIVDLLEGTNKRFVLFAILAKIIENFVKKYSLLGRIVVRLYLAIYRWLTKLVSPLLHPAFHPVFTKRLPLILFCGWILGIILSVGANGVGAYVSGTLGPDDPESRFLAFEGDSKNLKIYIIWAPLYVSLSLAIIIYSIVYWRHFRFFANYLSGNDGGQLNFFHVPASLYISTLIALTATFFDYYNHVFARYGIAPLPRLFWYLCELAPGQYGLNAAGYFHYFSNAIKLWLVVSAVIAYLGISIELVRCVHAAHCKTWLNERDKRIYAWCVKRGDYFFIFIVWLFIVIVLHNITWTGSPSGQLGFNRLVTQIAIVAGFIFVIEIPRHYVKYRYINGSAEYQALHKAIKQDPKVKRVNLFILGSKIVMYFAFIEVFLDQTIGLHINEAIAEFFTKLSYRVVYILRSVT